MKARTIAAIVLLVIVGAGLVYWLRQRPTATSTASSASSEGGSPVVQIGYSRLRISLPVFVAKERKLFEKHGVTPRLVTYDTAQPMMQALVEDKISLAGYTALPITYAAMARSGKQLYFTTLMLEDQQHRISFLLRRKTPPGSRPAIASIADLKGKKVGILPTIAYKAWLEVILKENKVDPSTVVIQNLEPLLQVQALASGGVDALFTNDPPATAALVADVGETIDDFAEVPKYLGEPFPFGSFNVSKTWADGHPKEFRAVIAALDDAIDYVNRQPGDAKALLRPFLPEAFQPHVTHYPDARYSPSREATPRLFEDAADQYAKLGIIPKKIDLTGLVISQ